jgi:hypothetical protein
VEGNFGGGKKSSVFAASVRERLVGCWRAVRRVRLHRGDLGFKFRQTACDLVAVGLLPHHGCLGLRLEGASGPGCELRFAGSPARSIDRGLGSVDRNGLAAGIVPKRSDTRAFAASFWRNSSAEPRSRRSALSCSCRPRRRSSLTRRSSSCSRAALGESTPVSARSRSRSSLAAADSSAISEQPHPRG